ncbi:type II toxin-antitoxin system HicA family toxin [Oligella urethralis]|nr:type II toxin-antitoxin system HicA family toxin [Oligella urethralis]AVL70386.1 type II toxin-antitoxin system HicA family toxin [Oligella urethralis]MDK6202312.1 type II toxin-antitoxin system HicA family toxin [Oligella urethralis]
MKTSEFRRWLKSQGVEFKEGSKHTKLTYKGKHSTLPRHAKELPEGTRKAILKQLGL